MKKIKDYTLNEIFNFCVKYKYCSDCPFYKLEKEYEDDELSFCIPQFIRKQILDFEVSDND